jgi:hypothetical protein
MVVSIRLQALICARLEITLPRYFAFVCILLFLLNTSTHTQPRNTPTSQFSIWDHNGSVMYLVASGSSREFYYQKPRPGMLEAGARPGALLFRGQIKNAELSGTAYLFNPRCGAVPFEVKGSIVDNDERILLTGQAPQVGQNCKAYGSYANNLEFRLLKRTEEAQSQQTAATAQTPIVEKPKAQEPLREVDKPKLPNTQTVQPSVTDQTPSASKDLVDWIWAIELIMTSVFFFGILIWTLSKT